MKAIIFIGILATGKFTFFQQRFFATQVRINLDMLKTRNRERILLAACLFDQLFYVEIAEDGQFVVKEWSNEI